MSNASSAGYVSYGDGIVVMNKDGATYYDKKGTKVWSAPYDMSNPKANVKGDYLLIYDLKGKKILQFVINRESLEAELHLR